jgi:hypothetical protein
MTTYAVLSKIIPADQALANKAIAKSLRQAKNIFRSDLQTLAPTVTILENNYSLPLIQALTEPVPQNIIDYYNSQLATGTGPGNTLVLTDVIGTAAGTVQNQSFPIVTTQISSLSSAGSLNTLTGNGGSSGSLTNGVYTVMQYCLAGAYNNYDGMGNLIDTTIPAGLPGAGTYTNEDNAFSAGLIPAANTAIGTIAVNNSTAAATINTAYNASAQQLVLETDNRARANIDFTLLESNVTSLNMGLASQLHSIGIDTAQGGQASFFESIATINTLTGQAVISSMREGRNIERLNQVNIILDTQLPDDPIGYTPAVLLPAQTPVPIATQTAQTNQ